MRIAIFVALCLSSSFAFAQTTPPPTKDSPNTTGRTVIPEKKEAQPLDTKSTGGAPASSPQGETPPGMQSAPEGSSKVTK
jgi:hypothetical protein